MKFIYTILIWLIFLPGKFNLPEKSEHLPAGTYVISANQINNGTIINLIDADSLFVYKNWVAEVKMKTKILEINDIESRKNIHEGFYIINLQHGSFAELKDLKNLNGLKYKPLSEKKTGFDFSGGKDLFHNEPYHVENSIYEGKKARKISYTIKGGPYNNKQITIYVCDILSPNQPLILYPQMEKTFKGSIKEIQINLEEQAMLVIHYSFSQKIKKEYRERLLSLSNITK